MTEKNNEKIMKKFSQVNLQNPYIAYFSQFILQESRANKRNISDIIDNFFCSIGIPPNGRNVKHDMNFLDNILNQSSVSDNFKEFLREYASGQVEYHFPDFEDEFQENIVIIAQRSVTDSIKAIAERIYLIIESDDPKEDLHEFNINLHAVSAKIPDDISWKLANIISNKMEVVTCPREKISIISNKAKNQFKSIFRQGQWEQFRQENAFVEISKTKIKDLILSTYSKQYPMLESFLLNEMPQLCIKETEQIMQFYENNKDLEGDQNLDDKQGIKDKLLILITDLMQTLLYCQVLAKRKSKHSISMSIIKVKFEKNVINLVEENGINLFDNKNFKNIESYKKNLEKCFKEKILV